MTTANANDSRIINAAGAESRVDEILSKRIGTGTVTADGKLAVEPAVLEALDVSEGDEVRFIWDENDGIMAFGSFAQGERWADKACAGFAEELGVETPEDLDRLIWDFRNGKEI